MPTNTESFKDAEYLSSIIDAIPTAIVMVDSRGQIALVNKQTEILFGYTREQILNEPIEVLVPFRYRQHHPELRESYFNDASVRPMGKGRDLFGLRKDGAEFPIEIGLNPIRTDKDLFVLSAIVDITERKRLEARFRATVESAPSAMIMIDPSGSIILVNQETSELFGYQPNELLGEKVEVLVPNRFSESHPQLRTNYFAESKSRRMGAGRDLFGVRKDGTEFPIEIGLNPVSTDEGHFVLAAIVDLTERRKTEERLRAMNEALEVSNLELQQFAYIASHDLQTPLRTINGFSQRLRDDFHNQLGADGNRYIERIHHAIYQMQTLIDDLLAFSRVDRKADPFTETDLNLAVDSALEMLGEDASLMTLTKQSLPVVRGDRSQLMQLFLNLLGNAIKYRSSSPLEVSISVVEKDANWEIHVTDNGIGIEEKHFDKIFEIFKRLHTNAKYPGTGIGLALCRRIIHRHGGEIWVESAPAVGSTFIFSLPQRGPFE